MVDSEIEHKGVERLGGHAGLHLIDEQVEHMRHELASLGHAGEGFRSVQLDLGVARVRAGEFEVGHRAFLT